MGNVLHVIFHYFIDTQAGVVRVERLLLHKGDMNNVLPTAITYRSVPRHGYCKWRTVTCGVYCDTPVHQCINPALLDSLWRIKLCRYTQNEQSQTNVLYCQKEYWFSKQRPTFFTLSLDTNSIWPYDIGKYKIGAYKYIFIWQVNIARLWHLWRGVI